MMTYMQYFLVYINGISKNLTFYKKHVKIIVNSGIFGCFFIAVFYNYEVFIDTINRFAFNLKLKLSGGTYVLDLFAAEDEGRTEQPTELKKRRAREEEGRVVNSQEINQAIVLAVSVAITAVLMMFYVDTLRGYIIQTFSLMGNIERGITAENVSQLAINMMVVVFKISGPLLITALFVGLAANLAQTKFLFTTKSIKVDLKRIAPTWKNFKDRVLFSPQNLMNMAKVLFKMFILIIVTSMTIKKYYSEILVQGSYSLGDAASFWLSIVIEMFFKVIAFMIIVAAVDHYFQKRQYINTLKMSKHEVKQEFKDMEGDPLIKGKMQEMARRIVNRSMMKAVPEADVVITNPTHFAIALKYESGAYAPTVIAKGVDNIALKIKEIAKNNDVEIVENKPLARELYYNVEIGQYIPEEMFNVVSVILASVYRMRRMKSVTRRGA